MQIGDEVLVRMKVVELCNDEAHVLVQPVDPLVQGVPAVWDQGTKVDQGTTHVDAPVIKVHVASVAKA